MRKSVTYNFKNFKEVQIVTNNDSTTIFKKSLTSQQVDYYSDNGFLLINDVFDHEEVNKLLKSVNDSIFDQKSGNKNLEGGLILEEDKTTVRTMNGLHFEYEVFSKLCCHPRLLFPTQQILSNDSLYVYQFKINIKEAFTGDVWEWHQDYIYWLKGDGIPESKGVSLVIFLDDITEFNAPLMLIPGSHKLGLIDVDPREEVSDFSQDEKSWMRFVAAKLQYPAPKEVVSKLAEEKGIVAPKCRKGSILFFHGDMLHASAGNISPFPRRSIFITYNPVSNVDLNFINPRPHFLSSRDLTPLSATTDCILKTIG